MPATLKTACAGALLACTAAAPAWAAFGQIDGFGASATTVTPGTEVQFWVSYSVTGDSSQWGGNDLYEPAPQEGYQYWMTNWYFVSTESISSVTVTVGGQSQTDYLGFPGSGSAGGTIGFTQVFDSVGTYQVDASAAYGSWIDSYQSLAEATRNCWYNDPELRDQLYCDAWQYVIHESSNSYGSEGWLGSQSITITVTAVPEPATLALWAGGLAWLGARAARRRRSTTPR